MAFTSFAPLRHRSFALALTSSFVSSTGTWMQTVALGVFLTQTTHDARWLGLLTVAAWAPSLFGAPIGGVIADRWNRQRWIQFNNIVMALTASSLAVAELSHHLTPSLACYLALIEGFASFASWAAWQSLLPDLVTREEVLSAVALSSAQFNLGRIIGPLCAGVALAVGSPGICFAANAASFLFVVVTFAFVRSAPRPPKTTQIRIWSELKVGARVAWSVKGCRYPILGIGTVALLLSPFITLVPAMAIDVLHAGKVGTSWLVTAQGVGAVTGALTLPALARRTSRILVLRLSVVMGAVAAIVYGVAPNLVVAVLALTVLGGAYLGILTGLNASVQLHAPANERSRILSLYTLSLSLGYPLGAVIQTTLAKIWGVRTITEVSAALLLLVMITVSMFSSTYWAEIQSTPVQVTNFVAD